MPKKAIKKSLTVSIKCMITVIHYPVFHMCSSYMYFILIYICYGVVYWLSHYKGPGAVVGTLHVLPVTVVRVYSRWSLGELETLNKKLWIWDFLSTPSRKAPAPCSPAHDNLAEMRDGIFIIFPVKKNPSMLLCFISWEKHKWEMSGTTAICLSQILQHNICRLSLEELYVPVFCTWMYNITKQKPSPRWGCSAPAVKSLCVTWKFCKLSAHQ